MEIANRKQQILSEINRCVSEGELSYIDAAVHVAEILQIDIDVIGKAVKSCPETRKVFQNEGVSLNILPKHDTV